MTIWNSFLTAGAVIWLAVTLLWWLSLWLKDASIVDIFWGFGFVVAGWTYFGLSETGFAGRKWLVVALVTVWGLRLTLYLARRNLGHGEDFRYQRWRAAHGSRWWWRSYVQVFLLQGGLMWLISAPLLAAQHSPNPAQLTWVDGLAVAVWLIGFLFESLADWQLARFKAQPGNKGQLLSTGLWRYTRHPNYFGDALQWWGFYLLAVSAGGWATMFSPVVMTLLLRYVSGVRMLEKSSMAQKPGFAEYAARTNAFFPWFPK
jgi:steroid 5-alpha reductase family enzyme